MYKCYLVERGKMFEVIINGKSVGKGQAGHIHTAYWFYKSEGMDVEIIPEQHRSRSKRVLQQRLGRRLRDRA